MTIDEPCSVCAGTGLVHTTMCAICSGSGLAINEMEGLRKYALELETCRDAAIRRLDQICYELEEAAGPPFGLEVIKMALEIIKGINQNPLPTPSGEDVSGPLLARVGKGEHLHKKHFEILTSNPSKRRWVCEDCGERGYDGDR